MMTTGKINGRMGMISVRPFFLLIIFAVPIIQGGCEFDFSRSANEETKKAAVTGKDDKTPTDELLLTGLAAADGQRGFCVQPSIYRPGSELQELDGQAVKAVLPPKAWLTYQAGRKQPLDIANFTHLAFDMEYSGEIGVCQVIIDSDSGQWTSRPIAVSRGVNQVILGIHQLWRSVDFDVHAVSALKIGFPDAELNRGFILRNVRFLRDLRNVSPSPAGIELQEIGWDYILKFCDSGERLELFRSDDGLWRMGLAQPVLRLARFGGRKLAESGGEELDAMGKDRFGEVDLLEHNIVRIQLADNWYFNGFEGGIKAFSNRYVRWTYTIYGDGRCVVAAELDNSGGPELEKVEISVRSQRAAWHGKGMSGAMSDDSFIGPMGKWTFMTVIGDKNRMRFFQNYLNPAKIKPILSQKGIFAPGDADRDGFDESQGCYCLAGRPAGCKFEVICDEKPLFLPIFKIFGPWKKLPTVVVEGRRIEKKVLLGDGSVLFELPGEYRRNFTVEVLGEIRR
ncbi:MAG TPA: hypothetical protein PLK08_00300 [Phycisphaerae bacterium]|nr:hypothetical protein [Phycisphaerae bacterium]